ncbi:secreted protein [methanotrophic bacterial endosymbiont of Bathymodiolus sp.]|nr:secreted protein [methanotrophic bacterial endosymbiont of Bathymodiolus sp.]
MLLLQRVALGLVFACLSACEQQAHQAKPPLEKVVKYANQLERIKKQAF